MVECKNHDNEAECVASLAECCARLRGKFGYQIKDARTVALTNVRAPACSTMMILNLLDKWSIGGNAQSREQIARLLGLKDFSTSNVQINGNRLHYSAKISLVVIAQFQIESCLKNLARDIHLPAVNRGFYGLAKGLLDRLKMPGDFDMFYTPARIRNSLHAYQGFHDSQGFPDPPILTISGLKYEFRDGVRVECSTVAHIAHALEASVEALGRIFSAPEIMALSYVEEPYATEIEAARGKNGEETD